MSATGVSGAFQNPNLLVSTTNLPYTFGNIPRTTGEFRTDAFLNEDFSILKSVSIVEGQSLVLKAELINAFNRHIFLGPDQGHTNPANEGFGAITGTSNPRQVQFTLRYQF
jgi:hypothetical protein